MALRSLSALFFALPLLCATSPDANNPSTDSSLTPDSSDSLDSIPVTPSVPFTVPRPSAFFFETFQLDGARESASDIRTGTRTLEFDNAWHVLTSENFPGEWAVGPGLLGGLEGDSGLIIKSAAKKHAIVSKFKEPLVLGTEGNTREKDLVVQYEVRFNTLLACGGAYIKLLTLQENWAVEDFHDKTPYTIMFGPDKCGATNKVHFILRYKSPVTGLFEEKHFKNAPAVSPGTNTHVYTLVIRPDHSFEIFIDQVSSVKGNLLSDMDPAINPPPLIDDPDDFKPSDWVDDDKIADPEARKPDDWDENAPRQIEDSSVVKPSGWMENAPETIPDPNATKPNDWDEESDGVWEAPLVPNPVCEQVGCGEWKRPKIANPAFKGKWTAPLIPNPAYKGVWVPKQVPNPNFFEDKNPYVHPVGALGIEVWTMQNEIEFDNFFIGDSLAEAQLFAANTFGKKSVVEKGNDSVTTPKNAELDSSTSLIDSVRKALSENPSIAAIVAALVIIALSALSYFCFSGFSSAPERRTGPATQPATSDANGTQSVAFEETKTGPAESESEVDQPIPAASTTLNDEAVPKKRASARTKTPKE